MNNEGDSSSSQGSRVEWDWKVGSVEEWKFDCVMRKLTVGRSIALLVQSLDCYKDMSDFVGN